MTWIIFIIGIAVVLIGFGMMAQAIDSPGLHPDDQEGGDIE